MNLAGQPLSDLSAVHLAVSRLTTSSGKGSYRLRSWRPLEQSGSKESQDRIAPVLFPGGDGVAFSHMPSFASSGRMLSGSSAIAVKASQGSRDVMDVTAAAMVIRTGALPAARQDDSAGTACEISHKTLPRKRPRHGGQECGGQPMILSGSHECGLRNACLHGDT